MSATDERSSAAALQAEREAADYSNHRERVTWLESPSPCWADGTPVDAHSRHALLAQSRNFLTSCKEPRP